MEEQNEGLDVKKIVGAFLLIFGIIDFSGTWYGFEIWWDLLGIWLPDILYYTSPFIEIGIGVYLLQVWKLWDEGPQ